MRGLSGLPPEKKRGERAEKRHDGDAVHGGGQAAVVVGHPAYGGCRHAADTDGHAEGDAGGEAR